MKVLVTDKIDEKAISILRSNNIDVDVLPTKTEDELCKIISQYDGIMVRSATKVTEKVIKFGKNLKIIGRAGVGVDNIDLQTAFDNNIWVVNSPNGNTASAAELTIGLILSMARNICPANESTSQGKWERANFVGDTICEHVVGIIGFGKIGKLVAKVMKAMGANIIIYDPMVDRQIIIDSGFQCANNLQELLAISDYISIHVPKTESTTHLINEHTIKQMKDGVRIVNCSRGGIIDEQALAQAIKNGKVKCAALDVYETEPNVAESPLMEVKDKVIFTPHLGASTTYAQLRVAQDVANDFVLFNQGKNPINYVGQKPQKVITIL